MRPLPSRRNERRALPPLHAPSELRTAVRALGGSAQAQCAFKLLETPSWRAKGDYK